MPRLGNIGFGYRDFGWSSEIARVRVNQHAVMPRVKNVKTLLKKRGRSKKKISKRSGGSIYKCLGRQHALGAARLVVGLSFGCGLQKKFN